MPRSGIGNLNVYCVQPSIDGEQEAITYIAFTSWDSGAGPQNLCVSRDFRKVKGATTDLTFVSVPFVNRSPFEGEIRSESNPACSLGRVKFCERSLFYNDVECVRLPEITVRRLVYVAHAYKWLKGSSYEPPDIREIYDLSPYGRPQIGDVCVRDADGKICHAVFMPREYDYTDNSFKGSVGYSGCDVAPTNLVRMADWLLFDDHLYEPVGFTLIDPREVVVEPDLRATELVETTRGHFVIAMDTVFRPFGIGPAEYYFIGNREMEVLPFGYAAQESDDPVTLVVYFRIIGSNAVAKYTVYADGSRTFTVYEESLEMPEPLEVAKHDWAGDPATALKLTDYVVGFQAEGRRVLQVEVAVRGVA